MEPMGVIYSAVGPKYIDALIKSARSLKRHSPKIKIAAYVDNPGQITKSSKSKKLFHQIHKIPSTPPNTPQQKWGRYQKVIAMSKSPYETTLYLDVDTKIKRKIDNLFHKLHHPKLHKTNKKNKKNDPIVPKDPIYDLAIANSPKLTSKPPFKLLAYQKPHRYNSGVIVYRHSPTMKKVFDLWIKACENNHTRKLDDQGYLVDILNHQPIPVKFRILNNKKYNARHTMTTRLRLDNLYHKVKILHESL